jgi:hypothetical protein
MSTLTPYLTVTKPFEETFAWTNEQLKGHGLQIEQTFDLQIARLSHAGCSCPYHGTDQCSCQMVVLLVRGEINDPLTLVLHGNDGQTSLSIVNLSGKRSDLDLAATVRQALLVQDVETPQVEYKQPRSD